MNKSLPTLLQPPKILQGDLQRLDGQIFFQQP
jgi:hypothetical protein